MKSIEEEQLYNEMPSIIQEIADLWGEEFAREFHKRFAGALLYIPRHYSCKATIKRVLEESRGRPLWKLQKELKLSRNTIIKYLKEIDDRRAKSDNK